MGKELPEGFTVRPGKFADQTVRQGSTGLGFANRDIVRGAGVFVDLMDWALQPLGLDSDMPVGGSK